MEAINYAFHGKGPRRMKKSKSLLVVDVENLGSGKAEEVHVQIVITYSANCDGKEVEKSLLSIP